MTTLAQVRAALASGDTVITKSHRGAFGGIVQYYALHQLALSRPELYEDGVQDELGRHARRPLVNDGPESETAAAAAYWRAVNQ